MTDLSEVRDTAEQRQLAETDLNDTRIRTTSSINRYTRALTTRDDAHHRIHHHSIAEQFYAMHDSVTAAQHRLDVLETWKRWAEGQTISAHDVHQTIEGLIDRTSWKQTRESRLGQAVEGWAVQRGITTPNQAAMQPRPHRLGIEIEL